MMSGCFGASSIGTSHNLQVLQLDLTSAARRFMLGPNMFQQDNDPIMAGSGMDKAGQH